MSSDLPSPYDTTDKYFALWLIEVNKEMRKTLFNADVDKMRHIPWKRYFDSGITPEEISNRFFGKSSIH